MLVRFKVANFLSFKDLQEFTLVAGDSNDHPMHIYHGMTKTLDRAILYGPNSSGKSNFVNAIAYARIIACKKNPSHYVSPLIELFNDYSYKTTESDRDPNSYFEFFIEIDGIMYSYGLEYNTNLSLFHSEWLYKIESDGSEECIFNIVPSENIFENKYKNDIGLEFYDPTKQSYLCSSINPESRSVCYWLDYYLLVFPSSQDSEKQQHLFNISYDNLISIINELERLDTGVSGLRFVDSWANALFEEELPNITCYHGDYFEDDPDFDYYEYEFHDADYKCSIKLSNISASLYFNRFVDEIYYEENKDYEEIVLGEEVPEPVEFNLVHKPSNFIIDYQDESEGTKRIFELLLVMHSIGSSNRVCTIIYDEFECSIHILLIKKLMEIFNDRRRVANYQFIATTHESRLLDFNLYRDDEIWFIEPDDTAGSKLYPLDSFKNLASKNYGQDYLNGIFGAIPSILNRRKTNDY